VRRDGMGAAAGTAGVTAGAHIGILVGQVNRRGPKTKNPARAGYSRFSTLFSVAAIAANDHGANCVFGCVDAWCCFFDVSVDGHRESRGVLATGGGTASGMRERCLTCRASAHYAADNHAAGGCRVCRVSPSSRLSCRFVMSPVVVPAVAWCVVAHHTPGAW